MKNNKNVLFMIRESYLKTRIRSSDSTERSTNEQGSFHREAVAYFKYLQKQIFFVFLFMLLGYSAFANNISISNASLTGQVNGSHTMVQFDISWDNSWRTSTDAANWDAAWVFVKYRVTVVNGGDGLWHHAWLNNTNSNHIAPSGSEIKIGVTDISGTDRGIGAFFQRSGDGTETPFSKTGVKLRWEYVANSVADENLVDVQIFAIEMVYVPGGAFYVGSGGTETGSFTNGSWTAGTTIALSIASENELTVAKTEGNLWYTATSYDIGDQIGPIPEAFPKGFKAFYCMKHEIMQQQYVDFLNTLTYTQQETRTVDVFQLSPPNSVAGKYLYDINRNKIKIGTSGTTGTVPAVYATDYEYVACNWLSWDDLAAYLDWSGLRPMTELEFEKSCRGTTLVDGEYSWGSTSKTQNTSIIDEGTNYETGTVGANCTYGSYALVQGPMRVGAFATSSSTRVTSGATYYGIMEMSGNLWERPVTLGHPTGRLYTGIHGNGALTSDGNADVTNWPPYGLARGTGFRGGDWYNSDSDLRVSDRRGASDVQANRSSNCGGRGVRTAP
ncbi:MAG: SUMF1/EgtB/PvdO family nonheme iron enzyme [Ignavibacteriae bacterium]|nr:SUMF1/EgtB/PvdO family nonheme iron enzyme [Ignavibacteriota bacterium]